MHLIRFNHDGEKLGVLDGDRIVDLTNASGGALTADVPALLRAHDGRFDAIRETLNSVTDADVLPREAVTLLPPIMPGKIICLGLNYRRHAEEANMALPETPVIFTKAQTSVIADGEAIVLPKMAADEVDYEAELAVVIGRRAQHVRRDEALEYVGGYTCANDVSARDLQMRTSQWVLGKMLDTFCPLGPALVTADEVPNPNALAIGCRLNGETMQASTTQDMIFDIPFTIEYLSSLMTLQPGDVILTGTPEGVGFSRTPPVFLRPGDVVEIEIEGLGVLRNPVEAEG